MAYTKKPSNPFKDWMVFVVVSLNINATLSAWLEKALPTRFDNQWWAGLIDSSARYQNLHML